MFLHNIILQNSYIEQNKQLEEILHCKRILILRVTITINLN